MLCADTLLDRIRTITARSSHKVTDIEKQVIDGAWTTESISPESASPPAWPFRPCSKSFEHGIDISAYHRYLESCFKPLLCDDSTLLWTRRACDDPTSAEDCWALLDNVVKTLSTIGVEHSIEEIWLGMVGQVSDKPGHDPAMSLCSPTSWRSMVIFALLCWSTMTLQPVLPISRAASEADLKVKRQQGGEFGLGIKFAQRPVVAVFHKLRASMKTNRWQEPIGYQPIGESAALCVSTLEYASLLKVGKIRLAWVNDLSSHLDFDVVNRRLSLFKFPSFCAQSILLDDIIPPMLARLTRALYSSPVDQDEEFSVLQVHREVLLSYRLLFAQSSKSRRLLKQSLRGHKDAEGDYYDTFLDVICLQPLNDRIRALPGTLWPLTCRDYDDRLLEQSSYNSHDDFPLFGRRLARLQSFSLRQQPSKLRDLWQDRRNLMQWYTFWAVLIVGGLTVLLGVLQLVVGVVQVVYSV